MRQGDGIRAASLLLLSCSLGIVFLLGGDSTWLTSWEISAPAVAEIGAGEEFLRIGDETEKEVSSDTDFS